MNILNQELAIYGLGSSAMQVLTAEDSPKEYDQARQVFNRRFDLRPWAIVFPENNLDVSQMVLLASKSNREIRVKGGGHDHEGECSANGALLLDMSKMKNLSFGAFNNKAVANIGVGWVFKDLIVPLVAAGVSIPHGTCQTVGITGFTLGGGWGPWTRKYGMCCEHLTGATIILGDGSIKHLRLDSREAEDRNLLWALRGGGGFSYGIVTELQIATFELLDNAHKFEAVWTTQPALKVLEGWEQAIEEQSNPELVGTNLQILAKPQAGNIDDDDYIKRSIHECHFFGYYLGDKAAVEKAIEDWFPDVPPDHLEVIEDSQGSHLQFSSWGRVLHSQRRSLSLQGNLSLSAKHDFPLEEDIPAPHKISSRLVNREGLDEVGRINLIRSLESDLLHAEGEQLGVISYVTLGAISGEFYYHYPDRFSANAKFPDNLGSAFPYKDRPYTIQYQVWWDTKSSISPTESELAGVNVYTNRAMDWIAQCRRAEFPQTSGAFISFKDADIATETYFLQNYENLVAVKRTASQDPLNRFRSRKTII